MNSSDSFLSSVEPFCLLPKPELERLAGLYHERRFKKGSFIFGEGEAPKGIWILKKGRIDICKYSTEGKPYAIEVIYPKQIFGTFCRMGNLRANYPCTSVAAIDSVVLCLSENIFQDLLTRFPVVMKSACQLCSVRLMHMQQQIGGSHDLVSKRLIRTLLYLSSNSHSQVLLFTKREIAELSGTTVETTIRTLRQFENKGWIKSSRGRIELKNLSKLEFELSDVSSHTT